MAFFTRWQDDQSRPTRREAARDLAVRALAPMALWWLVVLAIGWALADGPLKHLGTAENRINRNLAAHRTALLNDITWFFSWTGATVSIIGVCLIVVALSWWKSRRWWFAVVPLIAIALQGLVFFFTTLLINRPRPDVVKLDNSPPTSSYPSGHSGAATGLYVSLAFLALRIQRPWLRGITVTLCLLVPLLVASARLYRGMHHLSDVTVAILNGLIAALLAWGWLRRSPSDQDDDGPSGRPLSQTRA